MGKFLVKTVQSGFVFHLVASNGETIGTSQVYSTREACVKGVESVKTNAPIAMTEDQTVPDYKAGTCPKFEIYADHGEKIRFRLLAKNGQNILASQAYSAKANCEHGIASVAKNAPDAEVIQEADAD